LKSIYANKRTFQQYVFVFILFLIFSMYTIVLMTNSLYLPASFGFDAETIRLLIHGQSDIDAGEGFRNSAYIYRALGAETVFPEWVVVIIANVVYWLVAINILRNSTFHRQNLFTILFCLSWIFCSALFLSRYSKELLSLVPILLICFARMETHLKKVLVFLLVLEYVIFIRQYWAIILALYFALHYLFFRAKAATLVKLIVMAAIYFMPFWFSSTLREQYLTDWRAIGNLDSHNPLHAKSALVNPLTNTGPFTDYVNTLYAWLYLNIPVKFFFEDTIQYKIFAIFQIGSLTILTKTIYAELKYYHERRMVDDPYYSRCLSFVLAYSLTQAMFEPNVGSFLRHQIVLTVPLIYILYPRKKSIMQPV
jgi:hypothetical protein